MRTRVFVSAVGVVAVLTLHHPSIMGMSGVSTVSAQESADIADTLVLVGIGSPDTLSLGKRADEPGIRGVLFSGLRLIELILSDDSPEDGEAGAALFGVDVRIHDNLGAVFHSGGQVRCVPEWACIHYASGAEFGSGDATIAPEVKGGFQRLGFVAADGLEQVFIRLDFGSGYSGPSPSIIERVVIELVVGNDYRLEVLLDDVVVGAARASGNVRDSSNLAVIRIDLSGMSGEDNTAVESSSWGLLKTHKRPIRWLESPRLPSWQAR